MTTQEPTTNTDPDGDVSTNGTDEDPTADQTIDRPTQPEWRTLGSMAAESGQFMLVTFNSRGGAIERIELTERKENGRLKYRRVDVRSGYLGYFAADPLSTETGVRVNVVGPGTPAATAKPIGQTAGDVAEGIQSGDLIVSLDEQPVSNLASLHERLIETKPGQEIEVGVQRGDSQIKFQATLSEHPLDVVRLARDGGEDQVPGNLSRLSSLLTVGKVGLKEIQSGRASHAG